MVEMVRNDNDGWQRVKEAARATIGKEGSGKEPTDAWKKQILLAEHSPIRLLQYTIKFKNIPYFVVMHLCRHSIGISHFVKSQREDRSETHAKRSDLPQDAPVDYEMVANAQALINISRKRLCNQAAKETREAWEEAVDLISKADPVMGSVLVPECIYRGGCVEKFNPCGLWNNISKKMSKDEIANVEKRYDYYYEWKKKQQKN